MEEIQSKYEKSQKNLNTVESSIMAIYEARMECTAAIHHREVHVQIASSLYNR